MKTTSVIIAALLCAATSSAQAQNWKQTDTTGKTNRSMFRPLEDLPAPNEYRSASGAPGRRYWQQRVDYVIRATLDTVAHRLTGTERITYHNNSPDTLRFLWLQLDQNQVSVEHSRDYASKPALPTPQNNQPLSAQALAFLSPTFDGGHDITRVQTVGAQNTLRNARYFINGTQMRVDLARSLPPGGVQQLEIDWSFLIPDAGRGAKERLADGYLYLIAQWFPRLAVYDDVNGWQNDQFMGQGEFYLEFGNYDVKLTVPHNHIVNATGRLMNPVEVLTPTQRTRLARALTSETPVFIVAADEVMKATSRPAGNGMLTWHWKADNVRDFAFASSKLFVWDAAGFKYSGQATPIEASSYYPREAMPLWDKVSTKAILQTLKTYGRMSLEYPYPRATNVHGPIFGMEYPMVAYCGVRPNDGQYTEAMERALVSVSIHEVGHNWFPMIIASDERKWTWMDEGLNTFLQYYSEQDWQRGYPSNRGPAKKIVDYMKDANQSPIMIQSDLIHRRFGDHSYGKPAAGLVMLREYILGPERFDAAFRDYSSTWAFKKPQPADFFRTVENGAGENLSWFWRGWFYTTHANDQAVTEVKTQNSAELVGTSANRGQFYHRITLKNEAGLVMPVHMIVTYADGSTQRINLPVEIWRFNENQFVHGFFSNQEITSVQLDPEEAFADINPANNVWRKGQPIS